MSLRIPVTLREGSPWRPSLTADEVALLLAYLYSQNFKALSNLIARKLNIDTRSRVETDNRINLQADGQHWLREARTINKALAMELLVALSLTFIDNAEQVLSGCVVRNQQPNNFASSGLGDITVFYPPSEGEPAFCVLVEVSIKRTVSVEHYRAQLEQTYRHARALADDNQGRPVYGLVINSGDIAGKKSLHAIYRSFLSDTRFAAYSDIKVLALFTGDFINITGNLLADRTYDFSSSVLVRIFDALIAQLQEEKLPGDKDWVSDTWLGIVNESRSPQLDLK